MKLFSIVLVLFVGGVTIASAEDENACGETAIRAMQALGGCSGKFAAELKKSPGMGVVRFRPLGSGSIEKPIRNKKGKITGQEVIQEESWEFTLKDLTVGRGEKILRVVRKESAARTSTAGGQSFPSYECSLVAASAPQDQANAAVYDGQGAKPEDMNGHLEGSKTKEGVAPGYDRRAGDVRD